MDPARKAAIAALAAVAALVPAGTATAADGKPFFPTPCGMSHRAHDDPIVFPGRPGASHSHDFFGNLSTDAFSTLDSLRAAETTCRRRHDTAAYWVPTLYRDARPVAPSRTQIYYQASGHSDPASVRPFPPGLEVIAGDPHAEGAQPTSVVSWGCDRAPVAPQPSPPVCPEGSSLRLAVRFPQCWDGLNAESADHRSHMAYASRGACPASHPVPVPRIALNVFYPTRGDGQILLSSGYPTTAHADFLNAWDQAELERLIATCIHARQGHSRTCAAGAAGPPPLAPLTVSTPTATYGQTVAIAGRAGGRQGAAVRIEAERGGSWAGVAELFTGAGGVFSYALPARANGRYRAVGPAGRSSPAVRVTVRPRVGLRVRTSGRRELRVGIRTKPMKRIAVARVERLSGARWVGARRVIVRTARGRGSATVALRRGGRYRVRALTFADTHHVAGRTAARELRVR